MDQLTFRPATQADRAAILAIASQIWDGDDYLQDVIDDWLISDTGRLIVAEVEGRVAGLARCDRTFPGYAWFEGLRTDPAHQGRGIAKAITAHLVALARAAGVERMGLSTYFDNVASLKVSEGFGFTRAAGFAACSAETETLRAHAARSPRVESIPVREAMALVLASEALDAGRGFLPHSWRFYPFTRGPELALARMQHRFVIREGGRAVAMLLVGDHSPHGPAGLSLDFLEGDPPALEELVRHALSLTRVEKYVEAMVPCRQGVALPTLGVLQKLGFEAWNGGREDVLVLERGVR